MGMISIDFPQINHYSSEGEQWGRDEIYPDPNVSYHIPSCRSLREELGGPSAVTHLDRWYHRYGSPVPGSRCRTRSCATITLVPLHFSHRRSYSFRYHSLKFTNNSTNFPRGVHDKRYSQRHHRLLCRLIQPSGAGLEKILSRQGPAEGLWTTFSIQQSWFEPYQFLEPNLKAVASCLQQSFSILQDDFGS